MAADEDLTRPLGLARRRYGASGTVVLGLAAVGLFVIAGASVSWYLWLQHDQDFVVATSIDPADAIDTSTFTGSTPAPVSSDTGAVFADGLIDLLPPDGALLDIGEVIIHDPSSSGTIRLASLPAADLIEEGPYGPLPRVAATGLRPLDAYARPTTGSLRSDRIAIVIGGIGISGPGTAEAIRNLPGNITLGLAPYGETVGEAVRDARQAGHELVLQIPLEPFNYPTTNPGPQTLTRAASASTNIDRLRWLMAQATNYVGVMNYLGAGFISDADALAPVLEEIGARGLLFLDDGSSSRSVAGEAARGRTPFLRADITLDVDLTAAAIDLRLDQLQALARERGWAIASGSAFPLTVERVQAFADKAAERGIQIVPLSALLNNPG
ncbi:MAG: divergent polysaccharide deacetylase family protein [Alphaproteobacteria bacterium]